ncbi:MAG: hypothetical protein KBT04_05395 [Bacteroidales bacterium]|nr:hypothetical protein [Candidatus Colimorpha onthohippi]
MERLTSKIQHNATEYTEAEWQEIVDELEEIEGQLEQHRSQYTDEELREIGRLEGICFAQLTKYSILSFQDRIDDALTEVDGIMEGFLQEL